MERTEITKHGVSLMLNKPTTDEAHVGALETELGRGLPADYREFLLAYNGGRPDPGMFQFVVKGGGGRREDSTVHWFLSLHDGKYSNLGQSLHTYRDRIPPDTLPIASDPFGNAILIGLHGEPRGKVYFWDHEVEPDAQPDWSNVSLIAGSFDAFMSGLLPRPS